MVLGLLVALTFVKAVIITETSNSPSEGLKYLIILVSVTLGLTIVVLSGLIYDSSYSGCVTWYRQSVGYLLAGITSQSLTLMTLVHLKNYTDFLPET